MAKSRKQKNNRKMVGNVRGSGPIARKVIETAKEYLQNQVPNFSEWKSNIHNEEELLDTVIENVEEIDCDTVHMAYIYAQNELITLIEPLLKLRPLQKLSMMYSDMTRNFAQSSPPMGPLTISFFTSCASFDLTTSGAKRETMTSIAVDFCRSAGVDAGLIKLYEAMGNSRMGIYRHEGSEGEHVYLTELVTGRKIKAVTTTHYQGQLGELWFVRVLPPPYNLPEYDYWVIFNTPYVLIDSDQYNSHGKTVEEMWLSYFDRVLLATKNEDAIASYEELMKNGTRRHFWLDYVLLAYVKSEDHCIHLSGFPDLLESMPRGHLLPTATSDA